MLLQFKNIGESLGTRVLGAKIRHQVEPMLKGEEIIIFDFEGVRFISHSFADECFAKLLNKWSINELKQKTTFVNTPPRIKKTIAFTFKEHIVQQSKA